MGYEPATMCRELASNWVSTVVIIGTEFARTADAYDDRDPSQFRRYLLPLEQIFEGRDHGPHLDSQLNRHSVSKTMEIKWCSIERYFS